MRGNSPVQFLGEGVVATPPPYPTKRRWWTIAVAVVVAVEKWANMSEMEMYLQEKMV